MATRSKLQQVKLVYTDSANTWDVAEGTGQATIPVVDDEWAQSLDSTPITHLAPASTLTLALVHLQYISPCTVPLQQDDGFLGLLQLFYLIRHHKWYFRNLLDHVA